MIANEEQRQKSESYRGEYSSRLDRSREISGGEEGDRCACRLRSHCFRRVFPRECRFPLTCRRRGDHHHADQNEQSSQNRSQAKRFAAQEISHQHGHHRIHVRVGADFCRRFMMNQPDVGGERDDRAGDDQVEQREPRSARDGSPDENCEIRPARRP